MEIYTNIEIIVNVLGVTILLSSIATIVYLIYVNKLFEYIKNNYPAKYQELGEPNLSWTSHNYKWLSYYKITHFLKYIKLLGNSFQKGDKTLQNLVKTARNLLLLSFAIVMLGFVSLIIFSMTGANQQLAGGKYFPTTTSESGMSSVNQNQEDIIPGEIIARLNNGVNAETAPSVIINEYENMGVVSVERIYSDGPYLLIRTNAYQNSRMSVDEAKRATQDIILQLKANPSIQYAAPSSIMKSQQ